MKWGGVLVLLLFSMGCDGDYQTDIGGEYYVLGEGLRKRLLFYHSDSIGIVNEVYSNVHDFAFDERFLVLEQRPVRDYYLGDLYRALRGQYMDDAWFFRDSGLLPQEYEIWPGYTNHENYQIFSIWDRDSSIFYNQNFPALNYISDSLLRADPYQRSIINSEVNFWILDLKTDKLHGPLGLKAYLRAKGALGVSPKLKLNAEDAGAAEN